MSTHRFLAYHSAHGSWGPFLGAVLNPGCSRGMSARSRAYLAAHQAKADEETLSLLRELLGMTPYHVGKIAASIEPDPAEGAYLRKQITFNFT